MFTDLVSWGSLHYSRKMPYQGIQVFKTSRDLFRVPSKFMYVVGLYHMKLTTTEFLLKQLRAIYSEKNTESMQTHGRINL